MVHRLFFFRKDKKVVIWFSNITPIGLAKPFHSMFKVNSTYALAEKIISSQRGLMPLGLKVMFSSGKGDYKQISFGNWKGFSQKSRRKNKDVYDFFLWHNKLEKEFHIMIIIKENVIQEKNVLKILTSVEVLNKKVDYKKILTKGMDFLNKGAWEESKYCFINAIFEDPSNGEGYYYLARAFFLLEDLKGAKIYLEKCLKLNPNMSEALLLLSEIDRGKSFGEKKISN